MSSCGNCDCADKTQCPKKGNSYDGVVTVDAEKTQVETVQEIACENDGGCKCGTSCGCGANCSCGH